MPDVRDLLFPNYPVKVGNPIQYYVYNRNDLNRFATISSGDNDQTYASSCSYYNDVAVFQSLFLETDEVTPEPVRKVILWYEAHKIPWVCLHSGNRGFHLHGLFEPTITNHKTIKKFATMILKDTGTTEMFDPHVTADLKRLCRIPNTQRLGNGWCVPLTREEIFTINDVLEFKKLCVAPRFLDFKIGKRPSLFEFVTEEIEEKPTQSITTAPPKEIFFLKHILRPCVFKAIMTPNPKHNFRINAVIESFNHGLTATQIFNIFEKLNWIDFSHEQTKYQIYKIEEKRKNNELMIPFGKQKLDCNKKITCLKCIFES